MKLFSIIFNPAGLAASGLLLSWLIGLTGPERNIPNYGFLLIIPLLLFLGSYVLISKVRPPERMPSNNSQNLLYLAIFSSFINLFQLTRILPIYFTGNINLRVVENALSGTPIITQLSLLYVPYMLNYTIISKPTLLEKFVYYICLISIFIIPLKTYILGLFIMVLLSNIEERKIKISHITALGLIGIIIIPAVSILRIPKEFRKTMFTTKNEIVQYSIDEIRYYSSYNIANLSLELNSTERRNGLNIVGQLLDPIVYFATLGNQRLIQRTKSQGGVYHVLDGRKVRAYKKGVNMSTAFRAFIYDFGLLGIPIGILCYLLLTIAYIRLRYSHKFKTIRIVLLMIGLFCFWDWDLFETRYIFWSILSLL